MRILWHSNAPWAPTGYGTQTGAFVHLLKEAGHEVIVSCFYGLEGAPIDWRGIRCLPSGYDSFGNDTLHADVLHTGADIVISLMDVWVLKPEVTSKFRWVPWLPIDHDPAPPSVISALDTAYRPIAYSKFGVNKLREAGLNPAYVPHGINTDLYAPDKRAEGRRILDADDDTFVIGMVMANKGAPSRKAWSHQFRALGPFLRRHPNAFVYVHTNTARGDEDLYTMAQANGVPDHAFKVVNQYEYLRGWVTNEQTATLYAGFDVLMNASRGEGFGLPILEAQSAGVPVITHDVTAMSELTCAGWAVGSMDKFWYQDAYQFVPDVDELEWALEQAYDSRHDKDLRTMARDFAKQYDHKAVLKEHWLPCLEEIQQKMDDENVALKPEVLSNES